MHEELPRRTRVGWEGTMSIDDYDPHRHGYREFVAVWVTFDGIDYEITGRPLAKRRRGGRGYDYSFEYVDVCVADEIVGAVGVSLSDDATDAWCKKHERQIAKIAERMCKEQDQVREPPADPQEVARELLEEADRWEDILDTDYEEETEVRRTFMRAIVRLLTTEADRITTPRRRRSKRA